MLPCAMYTIKETYRKGKTRRQAHGSCYFIHGQNFHVTPRQGSFAMWFRLYCSIWLEVSQNNLLLCEYVLSDLIEELWEENCAKYQIFSRHFSAQHSVTHNNKKQISVLQQ